MLPPNKGWLDIKSLEAQRLLSLPRSFVCDQLTTRFEMINASGNVNTIQNSPAVKSVWPQEYTDNKCEIKGGSQDIVTIQVNLCCLLHVSLGFGTKLTWIAVIKFFAICLTSQSFLGSHFGYHIFFTTAFLG